jgi:gliding motility-associated-like protein
MCKVAGSVFLSVTLITLLFGPGKAFAQVPQVIYVGQLYALGVIPDPGDTYVWHIYRDHTLAEEADSTEVSLPAGNTGPVIPVIWLKAGTWFYTVDAINEEGCSNMKVGMLKVEGALKQSASITISIDNNPICAGTPALFRAITTNAGRIPQFTWQKNGMRVGSGKPYYIDSTLVDQDRISCLMKPSTVIKSDDPGSVQSNEIVVTVYTVKADFTLEEQGSINSGQVRLLNKSAGADSYAWDLGNCQVSSEENPEVTYLDDGVYLISLVATNHLNCVDTMLLKYRMMFKGLFIPNAFAPMASDGLPGVFQPAGTNLRHYRIEVFDHWGHLLWESTSLDENGAPSESWDGTVNGKMMPMDTYVWKVSAEFRDGTVWTGSDIGKGPGKTIGTVTLLK